MSYVVTFYTKAVTPVQEFYSTKKQALIAMSEDVKEQQKAYKNSGFKKVGSLKEGRISFEHPYYGVDYMVKVEKQ